MFRKLIKSEVRQVSLLSSLMREMLGFLGRCLHLNWLAASVFAGESVNTSLCRIEIVDKQSGWQVPLVELQEQFKASKYHTAAEWRKLYQDGTAHGWLQQVTDFYARFGGIQNPVPAKTYFETGLLLDNVKG